MIRDKSHTNVLLGMCLTVVGVVYLPAVNNHLVADSWTFMVPLSLFQTLGYFFTSIIPPEWKALWLRPVPMLFFWIDSIIWPGTEWGPHITNILIHLCNVWLIWKLTRLFIARPNDSGKNNAVIGAAAACLVYGLHPLTVGSVGWVAARFDVMCVTFGLSGMIMWLKWEESLSNKRLLYWSLLLFFAAILSKEQGVVFIATCFVMSLSRGMAGGNKRPLNSRGLLSLIILMSVYMVYRVLVFKGIGGYLEGRHGLSLLTPLNYMIAIFHPFSNVYEGWKFSITVLFATLVLICLALYLWKQKSPERRIIPPYFIIGAVAIFILGLATTAPNPGLSHDQIMAHAESRFALIGIAGFSLLIGIGISAVSASRHVGRAMIIIITIWSISAAWRTNVQLQSWKDAGEIADSIIENTLIIAPNPQQFSRIIFIDIPRNNEQYAYIFGIGLKEALQIRYGNRTDIDVVRYPKPVDFGTARPEVDFVIQYHKDTGQLERLTATKRSDVR